MNKKLISKLLAMVVITTGVSLVTTIKANAEVTPILTASTNETSSDLLIDVDMSNNILEKNVIQHYYVTAKGGSGNYIYYYKVMKDTETLYEVHTKSNRYVYQFNEAGNYSMIFTVVDRITGKSTYKYVNFEIKDTGKNVTAPSNLKLQYLTDDIVRVSWAPSVATNCKLKDYVVLYGETGHYTKNTYYDLRLEDTDYQISILAEAYDENGYTNINSEKSPSIWIPAKIS